MTSDDGATVIGSAAVDRSQTLLQIAEIALGLAGCGGIFVALSRERGTERRPADTYRLVLLMSAALSTLVVSLLPTHSQPVKQSSARD